MEKKITNPITLYSYYRSSCSYRVRIALNLKNIPFEYKSIHLLKKEQQSRKFQNLNPIKQVPCLVHKSRVITQSMAILQYLEELYPKPSLFPLFKKVEILSLCEIINSGIQPLHNLKTLQYLETVFKKDPLKKKQWIQFWITNGLLALETHINKKPKTVFSLSSSITAVELFIIPQMYSARRFNVSVNLYPRLLEIENMCLSLSAFKKAHPLLQPDAPKE